MSTQQSFTSHTDGFVLWDKLNRLEQENRIIPSPYVQIDDFLSSVEADELLNYAVLKEQIFEPAEGDAHPISRQAMLLFRRHFPDVAEFMIRRVHERVPAVLPQLNVAPFPITRTEIQLSASQDGGYIQKHTDNHAIANRRKLTYVYYFHRQPKPFSGGELLLYDSQIKDGYYEPAESFTTIEPRHNSLVFHHSRNVHEVLPVSCPSGQFRDSRFTIHGWLHR